jgi:threonine dehydrogenase-like Zn-dependent dehydrogenase
MHKGDILGHEFCGIVESVGRAVKGIKVGGRYVASFQIACGDVSDDETSRWPSPPPFLKSPLTNGFF